MLFLKDVNTPLPSFIRAGPGGEVKLGEMNLKSNDGNTSWEDGFNSWVKNVAMSVEKDLLDIVNPKIEKIIIKAALEKANGKKNEASILLGLGRNTLAKKIKELGI